jgi:hypothetical protein
MNFSKVIADWRNTPGLLKVVIVASVFAFVGDMWSFSLLGYRLAGVAWVVPVVLAVLVVLRSPNKVSYPWWLWLSWIALVLVQASLIPFAELDPRVDPLQRTLQLLCPLIIGVAVSCTRPSSAEVESFLGTFRRLVYVLVLLIGIKTGILLTGSLPSWSGLAPEAISITLFSAFALSSFLVLRKKRYLILWLLLLAIPVIMVTRMPIVACLLTLPIALGPMRVSRRIVAMALVAGLGLAVFYMPAFQEKTFYSASGGVADVTLSNPDLATSGRSTMWRAMAASVQDELWLGRGTGAGETLVRQITSDIAYPHNDWLLTLYDYGIVGLVALVVSLVLAMRDAVLKSRSAHSPPVRLVLLTGATAFIPFAVMMISDNILVYGVFFGNLQFALLGLGYGALARAGSGTEPSDTLPKPTAA